MDFFIAEGGTKEKEEGESTKKADDREEKGHGRGRGKR